MDLVVVVYKNVLIKKLSNFVVFIAEETMGIASKRITVVGKWDPTWVNFLY